MIISKPFRKFFFLHTSIYINKKDDFHVILNLNTIQFLKSWKKNKTLLGYQCLFMQSTVIFIDQKCTEIHIKLTIFLKEKVKMEGLIPNRSTGEKCSLYLSSGRPVVPLWEIREDLGRLPTQLKAHLRFTYIRLAIQLGFFCCCCFHAHMILVPLCNVQPSPHASLTKRRQVSHNTEASKLCPPMPGLMSTIAMEKQANFNLSKCTI